MVSVIQKYNYLLLELELGCGKVPEGSARIVDNIRFPPERSAEHVCVRPRQLGCQHGTACVCC